MDVLRAVFVLQLVVMLPAFAVLLATPVTLGTALLLLYLVPAGFICAVLAFWQFLGHRQRRGLAMATAGTPIVCLGLPFVIHAVIGGPPPPVALVGLLVIVIALAALLLIGRQRQWRGGGLFARRAFNLGLVVALLVALLLLWFPIITLLANSNSIDLPLDRALRDRVIIAAVSYFFAVAVPGFCLGLFAVLYAPVGLVRNRGGRLWHLGQLLLTLTLLATLAASSFALSLAAVNPG